MLPKLHTYHAVDVGSTLDFVSINIVVQLPTPFVIHTSTEPALCINHPIDNIAFKDIHSIFNDLIKNLHKK